jgi:hypothetical protein
MEKLKEKKQNGQQYKQAFHAISLYYELNLIDTEKDKSLKDKNQKLSTENDSPKFSVASRIQAHGHFKAEISLRHYFPNTRQT